MLMLTVLPIDNNISIDNVKAINYTKIDLVILPSTVHVNDGIVYGFVALRGFNNEYIVADKDINIDISVSNDKIVSTPSSTIINAGEYYAQFPIYIHSSGEAIISVSHGNLSARKSIMVVDDTINQEIILSMTSVSDKMLINSELLMFISLMDNNGEPIIADKDIPINISYPSELIVTDDNLVIRKGESHTSLIVRSYEHTGIAYIIATAHINDKEIKVSKTILIESDKPERLKIHVFPPVLEQGLRSISILIILLDSNNRPVKADKDIIINITSSDPSLSILNEESKKNSFIIKKGESSYYMTKNNIYFSAPKKIIVSASAYGLEGDSAVISIVEQLDYNNKKVDELRLKLFAPSTISANSKFIIIYKAYTVEDDSDDCPYYIEYYNSTNNSNSLDDIINRCKVEGFNPHPIDLLNNGEEYPVDKAIDTAAFVTTTDDALRITRNIVSYDRSYGVIELESYSGNRNVIITVNAQGIGIASTSIEIIDNRYPATTKGLIYADSDDYSIYLIVYDYNNRPIVVNDMIYIINPLGIIVHVEENSFAKISIAKNILHKYPSLEAIAVGKDVEYSLSTTIDTNMATNNHSKIRINMLLPFDYFIPITPILTGVIQISNDDSYPLTLNEDTILSLSSSSDIINIPTTVTIKQGRSYEYFNIEIIKNKESDINIKAEYNDYNTEADIRIALLEGSYNVRMYKTTDNDIEIRIYTQKDAYIIYNNDWSNNAPYIIHKDSIANNRDANGDYYAKLVLKDINEPLELRFLIQKYGYNDINGSAIIDPYNITQYYYNTEYSDNSDSNDRLVASFKLPQTIYANEINYLDIIINNMNGHAVDSVKIELKSSDLEVLNNNVYTNSDGSARVFFKPLHDGQVTLNITISKYGYRNESYPLTLYASMLIDEQRSSSQYYILIGAVGSIAALFTILFMNKKNIKEEELV